MSGILEVPVDLGGRSYTVLVGPDAMAAAEPRLAACQSVLDKYQVSCWRFNDVRLCNLIYGGVVHDIICIHIRKCFE